MLKKIIKFFLENKLVTVILLTIFIGWGVATAPFNWDTGFFPRDPVPVDAIPDLGENQQIVYTEWPGRSPQDIDDQITYPLTTALLGIPGVQDIRSSSIFGVSSIYVIFNESVDFYWSRTRIIEKLNSLPKGTLPEGITPSLGPDATALGQIFWYTLEGRDSVGNPAGGWDPQELRTIQDFYVKYALMSVDGVSEVASIGGFVKEYQVDIDPAAMKNHGVDIGMIMKAVKNSNQDIGARTIEFNRAEYMIRSIGYIKSIEDLEMSVVKATDNVAIHLKDVATISEGPATRRGGLDKGGSEAVGGVVVARFGANPMEVINTVKAKIDEISTGMPQKIHNGTTSKVTVVPFYDRSGLIKETLGTLESALLLEILISILVVIILVLNLRASLIISGLLPLGVLMSFIMMRYFGIDANIVALSGIAIAIGVMVDVGVVFTENIIRHLKSIGDRKLINVIYEATVEVAPAVITALTTTIVSFLPVFAMEAAEGKLFIPLAYTKTFAMLSALIIGIIIIPAFSHMIFSIKTDKSKMKKYLNLGLVAAGILLVIVFNSWLALVLVVIGVNNYFEDKWSEKKKKFVNYINIAAALVFIVIMLTKEWLPLGADNSSFANLLFVIVLLAIILGALISVIYFYKRILLWALENKWKFLIAPIIVVVFGLFAWQGTKNLFNFLPESAKESTLFKSAEKLFPGTGKEFMPVLDEGSFLLMPSTMPHAGIEENIEVIRMLDKRVNAIPEVETVVGKWGRVNSALDPAPISMFENVINYKSEYIVDEDGNKIRFKVNDNGDFILKNGSVFSSNDIGKINIKKADLIEDRRGEYFRQWRDHIKSPDDIWKEIAKETNIPGLTSAPKLQPIQTRLIMLQTGMRAPMGIKVYGSNLDSIEKAGFILEEHLKNVKGVKPMTVFADRVVGKPYLELIIDREAIARYGLTIKDMQTYISGAIGGMNMTTTVEGRERFGVRVRYARELRDNPEDIKKILIPSPSGAQIPLGELVDIIYTKGPQMIKSENTFLVGYVIFDKEKEFAEVDVVENAQEYLDEKIQNGEIVLPQGITYKFTGNYENQVRATNRLLIVLPLSLIIIFLILYFQFRSVITSYLIFTGIIVAFSGGFIMIWLYGQDWFLNFNIVGVNLRELFQIHPINLSVAVWVGFIALFGVATDDGVLIGTYLKQIFAKNKPSNINAIREAVIEAGSKRARPAIMTTATTIIALIPVLTSTGKGSDIMVPMAIPLVGGMIIQVMTMFIVPVLYSMWQEKKFKNENR